jgi:hypothetical protein
LSHKSLTAKAAKEQRSLTAKDTKDAKEEKSFTAKNTIIRTRSKPEGREGTAPKVAYSQHFWSLQAHHFITASLLH